MKRKIAALLMGTTLSVAVCGYSVQAMTYGYDMGGKVFISEDSSSSNLTEEEKEKLSDWHKEEMRNELAYLECYGVTYDADSDTLYYQGKTVRWLIDRQLEDTYKSIQMPEGEIDVYTVREDDYRLTGVRIATQEEYDQRTKEMEAAAGKESSYVQEAVDTETGSSIHMFAYDEETVTEANDGSATETAVVTEDVVSNYAEQKDTVENAVETAEGTCVVGDNLNSEIKIQEYKQNGIDLDSATGSWMWHGKEVHLLMDEDGSFYQNGSKEAKDNKIYLIVKREDDGRIKTVRQITMEEVMARIAHLNEKLDINVCEVKHIGKMLILTFENHEENMIDWIVSCLGIGVKSFQIQNTKTEKLKFRDLRIDFSCRKVIINNRQECTTAAAVVRVLGGKFLEVYT